VSIGNPLLVAVLVFVLYAALVAVVWKVNRVDYTGLAASPGSVVRGIVVPIGLGSLLLVVAVTLLGWWRPVLFDDAASGPRWAIVVPILFGVAAVVGVATIGWRTPGARTVPLLAVGTLLVGFAEEVATRGVLVVGAREAGWSPVWVFALSTGLFALLHGLNAFFGQPVRQTLVQIGMAALAGCAFYVTRLSTGTLLVGIVLHALWDLGTLGSQATGRTPTPLQATLGLGSYALALVALVVAFAA